jgi:acyl-CoA synthetase (AMP-forming)/AMP-acid ligase II
MSANSTVVKSGVPSIARGIPLSEEPGLGTLTLPGFLREVTSRFAEREALVLNTPDSVVRWTYSMLSERAFEVARALLACGVGKGSRVGVLMTNRPEWLAGVFGAGLAGAVAAPLSTFSTPAELSYLLKTSAVSTLLVERSVAKKDFVQILCDLEPQIHTARPGEIASIEFPFLRRLVVVGDAPDVKAIESWAAFLRHGDETSPAMVEAAGATVRPADTGALLFSSGSTAKPKGVFSSHRAIAIQCWRSRRVFALGDDVRCWTSNGFMWSGNFVMALGATLAAGGSLVLQRIFDPVEALQLMEAERVTYPVAWPHQWAQLEAAANWNTVDLSSLRYVDAKRPPARHPTISTDWSEPRWAYGNTETFTISVVFPSATPPEIALESHGIPLPGNTLKIVDPQNGEVVSRGQRGEIAVKGPTLMLGYVGIPIDETLDSEGFFHTGDGGYLDDEGRLFWEGRLTDVIKTGGANVSPLEVDGVLATCPGVKIGKTVGVPHDTLGEMVVTCVVPHEGHALQESDIRNFLKDRLASYKVPRRILFVSENEFSLTSSAKIKSNALRELAVKRL